MSIQAEGYRNLDKAANDSDQELPDVIHEVKNKKETPYKEMDILTEVITSESIDEIFCSPEDYVDSYYDRALIKIWADGKQLFTILIGIDDNEAVYLVAENDEVAEDYYPDAGETLLDVYKRIMKDWIPE